jgi:hypothetical protein
MVVREEEEDSGPSQDCLVEGQVVNIRVVVALVDLLALLWDY